MFSANAIEKLRATRAGFAQEPKFEKLGKVSDIVGTLVEAHLKEVPLGALVRIFDESQNYDIQGEVVGFRKDKALIVPFSDPAGVCSNSYVQCLEREPRIRVGHHLIGRILDGYCNPILGPKFQPGEGVPWAISREPLNPLTRRRISRPLDLGVRAINSLLTCGEGQRMGIFAGSGVGKSVLMGMIGRYTQADVNVIALIGERGREVKEFIDDCLGEEGLKKSVVIVSTGDQSPLIRIRAAHVATAISEYFRESGYSVLLMMDSLTRVAMAQREIGLAVGEPPTTKGYTPSVFSLLPRLLERAGNSSSKGSLTGIYTVLVDGDDFSEPVCDAARSILDGHIVLSRDLAAKNHYPAIDVLRSASRVMVDVASQDQMMQGSEIRNLLATYKHNEDLISIGAYNRGANPRIDKAIDMQPHIESFLRQGRNEIASFDESTVALASLLKSEGTPEGHG
jgi:flagellum-specific ATP synthase